MKYATNNATKIVQLAKDICNALIHRGEILEKIVRKWCQDMGKPMKSVADKIGYHRNILYRHFADATLSYSIIYKYGRAINYDFSKDLPEMSKEIFQIEKDFGIENNQAVTNDELIKEVEHWKSKYIALLEQYNEVVVNKLLSIKNS